MRIRKWLPAAIVIAATAVGMPAPAATAADENPTDTTAPYAVEDGAYPDADVILENTGAQLIAGDGNITLTSCSEDFQIMVWARNLMTDESRICFKAASTGHLSVKIPRAYRIETADRDIRAEVSIDGDTETLNVPKDTAKGFGEADPADPKQAVLLNLQVSGPEAKPPTGEQKDSTLPFTGKLTIGTLRSCTATLVAPQWVATSKSCFAENPAKSIDIPTGPRARRPHSPSAAATSPSAAGTPPRSPHSPRAVTVTWSWPGSPSPPPTSLPCRSRPQQPKRARW
ncbi:hypothetical protein [Streptomyces sp. I6]|uniref:hypothetical protein n=1 Tax=Streptomyces sp. I6 TaxID=2483113 RepID=UPI0011CE1C55|nr:hypothetical protein [Streptomyces sp. I6]